MSKRKTKKTCKLRTLATLTKDHTDFVTINGGDIKNAKEYNNVINSFFFDIPLDNVR